MRAYRIAYDGTPYHGFQRQPDVETVEGTLLDALGELDVLEEEADTPPGYAAAGRTDAGVSAVAQTIGVDAPGWLAPAALNGALPEAIRAWASADAPSDFHATHHAVDREYTYFLYAPYADDGEVRRAMDALAGEHDFHNLTPDGAGTRRRLTTAVGRDGPFLTLRFRADGFPRQLVRRAVTLVDDVARGEAGLDDIDRVLSPTPILGPDGIGPAPAEPLVLTDVSYDLAFEVDDDAADSTREVFQRLRADHATRARVAGSIADGI